MIVGFTGTREGMTEAQKRRVTDLVREHLWGHDDEITEAHHGDCVGADAEFHAIVRQESPDTWIEVQPPDDPSKRAFCKGDRALSPRPYLVRNAIIVGSCDILIAAPKEQTEQHRGGTWSTVRKAVKSGKPVTIVYPDGRTEER